MERDLSIILGAFSFWLGAVIASFLNVVIWRVPRGESIVSPPSHCPKCEAPIRWYQNIPILSWLALRGRCAKCREPISPRYILIETLGGALFLAAFLHLFGLSSPMSRLCDGGLWFVLAVRWIWLALMITGSMIDFDHKLLPDFVTVGGMILGVASSLIPYISTLFPNPPPLLPHPTTLLPHPLSSLLGLAFGFGLLWLVRFLGTKAFKREAMGLGDVFLMGAIGALFGPAAVCVTLMLSSIVGSVAGVSMIALSKTKFGRFIEIPFGPYICLGCLVWMFVGPELVHWYLSLLRV